MFFVVDAVSAAVVIVDTDVVILESMGTLDLHGKRVCLETDQNSNLILIMSLSKLHIPNKSKL